jgi:Co/Zn/Cd efflux system component
VWLCSRNDAIGNLAVMAAAAGVFGSGSAWPDLLVAALMALLGMSAARRVWRDTDAENRAHGQGQEQLHMH